MMPLSPQLQQHCGRLVADRLPTDFSVAELSPQARSVMAFSDFVEQECDRSAGLAGMSLRTAPAAEEWRHYEAWLQERLQAVTDEAGLMREPRLFRPPDDGPHRLGAGVVAGARRRDAAAAERPGGDPDCRRPRLAVLYAACCKSGERHATPRVSRSRC